jgi:hypothetical protein
MHHMRIKPQLPATASSHSLTRHKRARSAGRAVGVALGLCATLGVGLGCKSRSATHYNSPRVTGRVLDATTHQPIAGVRIQRLVPNENAGSLDQVKGGQILERPQPIRSNADGTFEMASQKSLTLWSQFAWFTVEISFAHSDYDKFTTNYTPADAVMLPTGESVIQAGDIQLQPKTRLNP